MQLIVTDDMLQGVAGLVCRKKRSERSDGDGTAAGAGSAAVASSVPTNSSSTQPSAHSVDLSGAVDSSHASSSSSSAVVDQSARQQVDAVTERLAGLQLSGGLRQRRRNGQGQDGQDTALSRARQPLDGNRGARRQ